MSDGTRYGPSRSTGHCDVVIKTGVEGRVMTVVELKAACNLTNQGSIDILVV
jgi:hypothetical protein